MSNLSTLKQRVADEQYRGNTGQKHGRQVAEMIGAPYPKLDPYDLTTRKFPRPEVPFRFEHLMTLVDSVHGWEAFNGAQIIWGTSFSRADIKEVGQMISILIAFQRRGLPLPKLAYFIDPNAHTTAELLAAMQDDFGICFETLTTSLETGEVDPRYAFLPPRFFPVPTHEQVEALDFAPQHLRIKHLMLQIVDEGCCQTLSDWRTELDRRVIAAMLETTDIPVDRIQVVDTYQVVCNSHTLSLSQLANEISSATEMFGAEVRARTNPNYDNGRTHNFLAQREVGTPVLSDIQIAEISAPVMLRLVARSTEGEIRRLGVTTEFMLVDLVDRQRTDFNEDSLEIVEALKHMSLVEAIGCFPIQPSGVGYMLMLHLLAMKTGVKNTAILLQDDYEEAIGPTTNMAYAEFMGYLRAFCIPKGLVGGYNIAGEASFDVNPDLSIVLTFDTNSWVNYLHNAELNAQLLLANETYTNIGVVVDAKTGNVTTPEIVPVRESLGKLIEIYDIAQLRADRSQSIDINKLTLKRIQSLIFTLLTLTPDRFHKLLSEDWHDLDKPDRFARMHNLLRLMLRLFCEANPVNTEIVRLLEELLAQLTAIGQKLAEIEMVSKRAQEAFTEQMDLQYLSNRCQALLGYLETDGLEAEVVNQLRSRLVLITTIAEVEKLNDELSELLQERLNRKITLQLKSKRPESLVSAQSQIETIEVLVGMFDTLKERLPEDKRDMPEFTSIEDALAWLSSACDSATESLALAAEADTQTTIVLKERLNWINIQRKSLEKRQRLTQNWKRFFGTDLSASEEGAAIALIREALKTRVTELQRLLEITDSEVNVFKDEAEMKLNKSFKTWIQGLKLNLSKAAKACELGKYDDSDLPLAVLMQTGETYSGLDTEWSNYLGELVQQAFEVAKREIARVWNQLNDQTELSAAIEERHQLLGENSDVLQPQKRKLINIFAGSLADALEELGTEYSRLWANLVSQLLETPFELTEI